MSVGRRGRKRPLGLPRAQGAPDSAGLGGQGAESSRGRLAEATGGGPAFSALRGLSLSSPKGCLADI